MRHSNPLGGDAMSPGNYFVRLYFSFNDPNNNVCIKLKQPRAMCGPRRFENGCGKDTQVVVPSAEKKSRVVG